MDDFIVDDFAVITQAAKRTRIQSAVVAVLLLFFAFILFGAMFLGWDTTSPRTPVTYTCSALLVLLLAGVGGWSLYQTVKRFNIGNAPVMRLLMQQPERIQKVYPFRATTRAGGVTGYQDFIRIHTADGKFYQLAVKTADVEPLLNAIAQRAPHAQVGYEFQN